MELLIAVSEPRVREVMDAAARHGGYRASWLSRLPQPEDVRARGADAGVLVHDLLPDPERQIVGLRALGRASRGLRVFLLLPLSAPVLRAAVRHGGGLPLVAVDVLTPDLTAHQLVERFRGALASVLPGLAVWTRVGEWPLPQPLRELARETLVGVRPHRRVGNLSRNLGIGYEQARRAAHGSGVGAPGQFAETLRLACAATALAQGARVYEAAERHGFRDADHLAARLRRRFGITPSEARLRGGERLLDQVEAAWFGVAPVPAAPPE